jgi:hypothetical protein
VHRGKGMDKKPLIGIVVCILILLPALSTPAVAVSDTKLYIGIIGGNLLPVRFNFVNGWIVNIGDNPAYNVSYTFAITGGFNNDINATFSDNWSEMPPKTGWGFFNDAYGFGPVTITLTVSASNADNVTKSVNGFQIGKRTLIPFSLLRSLEFALVLRLYVYPEQEQMKLSIL